MNTDLLRRKAVMLSEQRLGLWLGNIVIVPITAMVVMQEGAGVRLLGWVVAQYLLTLVRLADWRHMRRQPPREASAILRWFHQLTAFAFIGGALWGLCAWWFLDLGDIHRAVYIIVLLISIGTASLTGLAAWLPAYVAFVAPIALFVAASLFASGETAGEALAIACIAYFVATCIFARNYARTIDTVVLTNLENARLLADAERASLQKSNFVAAVSHDVRQPLYALGLFLEGLRNQLDSPSQIAIFEQARDAHRAVDDMFSALLEVSRLDAGAVVPALSHFRLGGVLDAIVAEARRRKLPGTKHRKPVHRGTSCEERLDETGCSPSCRIGRYRLGIASTKQPTAVPNRSPGFPPTLPPPLAPLSRHEPCTASSPGASICERTR